MRKYIEGMIEGFNPGPPNLNTCGEYLGYTTYKTRETVVVTGTLPSSLTSKASTLGALITLGLEGYCWWKLRNCVKK